MNTTRFSPGRGRAERGVLGAVALEVGPVGHRAVGRLRHAAMEWRRERRGSEARAEQDATAPAAQ